VALVGPNGAGKTTLLRTLVGLNEYSGTLQQGTGANVGADGGTHYIAQRPSSQFLGARVQDELQWGRPKPFTEDELRQVLTRVGVSVPIDQAVEQLSGGEAARVSLARVLLAHPAVVLIDELTAMLDPNGRNEIANELTAMASAGAAVIHATHDARDTQSTDSSIELQKWSRS
jgi:ABC-type Mn2+/Zn2+ transport system ATPase subunit